jgi:LTXXQ motif family protein
MDKRTLLRVFGAACAALPAGWSLAQMGRPGGPGGGMGGRRGGSQDDFGRKGPSSQPIQIQDDYELVEHRLMLLEEDLQLRPAQREAWQVFVASVRGYAGDLARERARAVRPSAGMASGGVQHIEQALDTARNRLTALEDIAAAAKSLYAVLSTEQKKMADSRVATIVAPRPRITSAAGGASGARDLGNDERRSDRR